MAYETILDPDLPIIDPGIDDRQVGVEDGLVSHGDLLLAALGGRLARRYST